MTTTYHHNVAQGTEEWFALRCGILTASEMNLALTPTLKRADNKESRAHVYELLAQRINQYVEPRYYGEDMARGDRDEEFARIAYEALREHVTQVGFVTNDQWGFTLGYSPDGLVGDDGLIEIKSRAQKYQVKTFVDNVTKQTIMPEYVLQAQTGLLVTGRLWLDHISYCGGMPMAIVRVYPDKAIHDAIIEAATAFEAQIDSAYFAYQAVAKDLPITPRYVEQEMFVGED